MLIEDPGRFDGVRVIGADEHVWRHTRRGDKYVIVIINLTGIREGSGPARLLDMVEGRSEQAFKRWLAERPQAWRNAVEATRGVYQQMIAAYREPDRTRGRELMKKLIESVSHGVSAALNEVITPRVDPSETRRRCGIRSVMATVEFRRLDPPAFQAYGPTLGWFIDIGDGFNFIGVSARPFQSNDRVRLEGGVDAVSRNDGSQFTNFRVTIFP